MCINELRQSPTSYDRDAFSIYALSMKPMQSASANEKEPWSTVKCSLLTRVVWRLLETPWRAARFRDRFIATEMGSLYDKVEPYTMVGYGRLRGLQRAVHQTIAKGVPGDIVECGTARGGSAAFLGMLLKKLDPRRRLWVFDTFEGIPPPTDADPDYEIARQFTGAFRGSIEEVTNLFKQFGFSDLTVPFKGLFEDTLRKSGVRPIAVVHIDCDSHRS